MPDNQYIAKIALDEKTVVRRNADIEHERKVAIFDILDQNRFIVSGFENSGPYSLHLSIEDNRLIFDVCHFIPLHNQGLVPCMRELF